MVPEPSEMSRTSGVRSILDISDGSGKGQPRAVKVASAGFAPRPFKPAKVSVRGRNMHSPIYFPLTFIKMRTSFQGDNDNF